MNNFRENFLSDPRISEDEKKRIIASMERPPISLFAMQASGTTFTRHAPNMNEHALLAYAMQAYDAWVREKKNNVYEGAENALVNYQQLFLSICARYSVLPEECLQAWIILDTSAEAIQLPHIATLPSRIKYPYISGGIVEKPAYSSNITKGAH